MAESKNKFIKAFILSILAVFTGFLIEFYLGQSLQIWAFPANIMLIICLVFLIIFTHCCYKKSKFYQLITHTQTTLAVLTVLLCLLLALGFIPQDQINYFNKGTSNFEYLYKNITTSVPFAFNLIILLYILGLTILKKKPQCSLKYISFQINHISLWIAICAGMFGAPDKEEYKIIVEPNKVSQQGYSLSGEYSKIPFAIISNTFEIERYPDELIVLQKRKNDITPVDTVIITNDSTTCKLHNMNISVIRKENSKIELAIPNHSDLITLTTNTPYHPLNESDVIVWKQGKPRHYKASIGLEYRKLVHNINIEINKPFRLADYHLYLESYEFKSNNTMPVIIFRVVKDPWFNLAQAGLWGILAGALLLIFTGPVHKVNNLNMKKND